MKFPWSQWLRLVALSTPIHTIIMLALMISPLWASESIVLVKPHKGNTFFDTDAGYDTFSKGGFSEQFITSDLTFNITYDDVGVGFNDPNTGVAVRNRLKDVLAYVADQINYPGRTLDIQVTVSETDGTGALASAGTFYPNSAGFHTGSTLQRLKTGLKPFFGFPEISVTVDVGFAWNVPAGTPQPGEADFFTVLLHEITHGLGFTSLIEPDGSSSIGPGIYTVFDSFLTDGPDGPRLLSDGNIPEFQLDVANLVGNDVWFAGPQARLRDADAPVPVYSPGPYEPGSSLSHWDINRLQSSSAITHVVFLGSTQRTYSGIDLGALIDIGYTRIEGAPSALPAGCTPAATTGEKTQSAGAGLILLIVAMLFLSASRWWRVAVVC